MSLLKLSLIVLVTAVISAGVSATAVWLCFKDKNISQASVTVRPVNDFALLDQEGRFHQLYKYSQAKVVVLYAHEIGCPMVDDALTALEELKDTYEKQGVEFLLINASRQDDRKDLQAQAALLGIDIPILNDESQLVSEDLDFNRSGEAVVLDTRTWQIRYRGPIDNRSLGQSQDFKAKHYLRDSINAVLKNEPVETSVAMGNGCFIEFTDRVYQRSVSYTSEIVPILTEKCISCHRLGGIGPWTMDSYQTVKGWSSRMLEVIMTKQMPPWHADSNVGHFSHDRSLTIGEQRNLIHWIKSGTPRGDGDDPLVPAPPTAAGEWPLGEPDLVMDLPKQKLPAQGILSYRWVQIPVPFESDTWVRAVQLKPSNPAVMHHGFVFVKYPKRLKATEPRWLEGRNGFFVAYVPGVNVMPLPENSGQLLPAGATLVFQLHYVTTGSPTADSPKLALYIHDSPPAAEYKVVSAANMKIRIPPYAVEHQETATTVLEEDGQLYGFYPHMHYRGKWMQYEAIYPDGRSEKLLSVPNYDIHWQTFYRLSRPKLLPLGTQIVVHAAFDNSENNPVNPDPSKQVKWGLKSSDEMLVGYFMYTRPRKEDFAH